MNAHIQARRITAGQRKRRQKAAAIAGYAMEIAAMAAAAVAGLTGFAAAALILYWISH